MTAPANPLGRLIAIGGAEDKTSDLAVLGEVVRATATPRPEIAVIASASRIPEQVLPEYEQAFAQLGCGTVHALALPDRAAAHHAGTLAALRRADAVFLTGGDQTRLTAILGGTPAMDAILERYAAGGVIAGTSAGAAAMSGAMIAGGDAVDALTRDALRISGGLGLLEGVVLDTHFLERGRFTRLMAVLAANPGLLGIGLGEDAAVVVYQGNLLEAIGSGHVMVVDGRGLGHTNAADAATGEALALEGLALHALVAGYGYDAYARAFLAPDRLDAALGRAAEAATAA